LGSLLYSLSFFLPTPPPPTSTLFPYTTLFRSHRGQALLAEHPVTHPLLRDPVGVEHDGVAGLQVHHLIGQLGVGEHAEERAGLRSEEHTSELQSRRDLVCRLLLEKKKIKSEST